MLDAIQLLGTFVGILNPPLGKQMREVAGLAREVAESFDLEATKRDQVEMAGLVHDIGLLSLPKDLQNKDVMLLTDEQYRLYCEHPVLASITLESIDHLAAVGDIVLFHHECMNGKGFPNGLKGDHIPIGSRIILAVSDYCRVIATWPRNMRKLISYARRHMDADEWKNFSFSDDPETIIEESAVKLLLKESGEKYDDKVVKSLIRTIHRKKNIDPPDVVDLDELKPGMILMEDLRLKGGRLLLTKGTKLELKSVESIQNMGARGMITHKIYVSVPANYA